MTRIIIVDDQQLLRRGLRMLLSTVDGFEVVGEAADGAEALALIDSARPDIVLTDLRMPGVDGVSLIAAVAERHPALPVLALTTFDDDALVHGAFDAGAAGFLLKSVSTDALAEAIRQVRAGGLVIDPAVARAAVRRPAPVGTAAAQTSGATSTASVSVATMHTTRAESSSAPRASGAPRATHRSHAAVLPDGLGASGAPLAPRGTGATHAPGVPAHPLVVLTPTERAVAEHVAIGATNHEIAAALFLAEGTVKNHVSALLRKLERRDRTALALFVHDALRG